MKRHVLGHVVNTAKLQLLNRMYKALFLQLQEKIHTSQLLCDILYVQVIN